MSGLLWICNTCGQGTLHGEDHACPGQPELWPIEEIKEEAEARGFYRLRDGDQLLRHIARLQDEVKRLMELARPRHTDCQCGEFDCPWHDEEAGR